MAAKNHSDYNSDTRLALLEQTNEHIYEVLNRIDKRFDRMDERFDGMELDFKGLRSEMKSDFRWLLTIMAGIAGIMAHGFHWF